MTREEKAMAIETYCDNFEADCCECPLAAVVKDDENCSYATAKFPCNVDRNYDLLVKAGAIEPEIEFVKVERAEIADSGDRREFDTGAVRDMQEGKGRCDLLPASAILRLAKHFERGANKYSERNWEKGIPVHSFIDSAIRHLMKYLDGWTDEDHLCAAAWNVMCAMWTEEHKPELVDIPTRPEYRRREHDEE